MYQSTQFNHSLNQQSEKTAIKYKKDNKYGTMYIQYITTILYKRQ